MDETIKVFIDGSCLNNQKKSNLPVSGGCGGLIIFPDNVKKKFKSELNLEKITNNIAELMGFYNSLKIIKKENELRKKRYFIYIYSDSKYVINIFTKYYRKWIKDGWALSNGKEPENGALIKEIKNYMDAHKLRVIFNHCEAHTKEPENKNCKDYFLWKGNNIAHEMAYSAACELREKLIKKEESEKKNSLKIRIKDKIKGSKS